MGTWSTFAIHSAAYPSTCAGVDVAILFDCCDIASGTEQIWEKIEDPVI